MRTLAHTLAASLLLTTAALASPFQPGDIFVSASDGSVHRYIPSGTLLQTMSAGSIAYGLAFDPAGNLYVATGTTVAKFDSSGNPLGTFASGFPGTLGSANDIAFDTSGHAYIVGIQDGSNDFVSKYSTAGTFLATNSVTQGQENWVYVGFAGSRLLMTPGTTSVVDPINPATLAFGTSILIPNGGPNGDVAATSGGGFLVVSNLGIEQFDATNSLIFNYNAILSGTFIGIDTPNATQFWAVSDFGEVRQFNLGSAAPIASFNTGVNGRGIAVFVPEPSAAVVLTAAFALLMLPNRRRTRR